MKELRETPRPTMSDQEMIKDYPRLKLEYTRLHEEYRRFQNTSYSSEDNLKLFADAINVRQKIPFDLPELLERYEVIKDLMLESKNILHEIIESDSIKEEDCIIDLFERLSAKINKYNNE